MAGSAGHILSPWEDGDLTFGQIREILTRALSGTLDNPSEKLDGQNIMMSFIAGDVYIARTPRQLRNNGAEAIRWDKIADFMKTPESKKAYSEAAATLQRVMYSVENNLQNFFVNGKYWLNMELLTPLMENIIPYGKSQLRIHNVQSEEGIVECNLYPLLNAIKAVQAKDGIEYSYIIDKTNRVSFKVMKVEDLGEIMEPDFIDLEDSINDFLAIELMVFIISEFKKIGEEDLELAQGLIRRWVDLDKSTNIKKLLSDRNPKLVKWVKETDPNIEDLKTEFLEPIIELFSKVGAKVLLNLEDIASSDPEEAKKIIITKAQDAINKMKGYKGEKSKFLEVQYNRFLRAGGFDSVAPIEGIVFEFEGKLFKLTGSYLPLLKIISFFRFGRDKE